MFVSLVDAFGAVVFWGGIFGFSRAGGFLVLLEELDLFVRFFFRKC